MQQIEQNIFLTNAYPGVTLGALILPAGVLMIDAPPHPDHGRSWQAALRSQGGVSRMLVNLDAHIDRTLGVRVMDCPVIAHEKTGQELDTRPAIFKGQTLETGAEWEICEGLSGLRWTKPVVTFTDHMHLEWGEYTVTLEYHPGPSSGAIWLIVPDASVVFIGDAVVVNQPPFLESANLPKWIAALDLLLSPAYKNYLVISGRSGEINLQNIREQRAYLKDVLKKLEKLHQKKALPNATENMIPNLLSHMEFPKDRTEQYTQRLQYGLQNYFKSHYLPADEVNGTQTG
jgi:glyoxylase-like metal-dependent hydrolase (beta-lactamase superfamily II)